MISIVKAELYRIRYAKVQYVCLCISLFFTLSLCVNYEYLYIEKPLSKGVEIINSWESFFEYFFADYSMFYPLILAVVNYFLSDIKFDIYPLFVAKGIKKKEIFAAKMFIVFLITAIHFGSNILFVAVLVNGSKNHFWGGDIERVFICILLQLISYMVFSSFVVLLANLFRKKNITIGITIVFIAISYFYLVKIGDALDIKDSLYEYWIIGFSTNMMTHNLFCDITKILIVVIQFSAFIYLSYKLFVYHNGGEA